MGEHLAKRSFFVGERYTIADIALFGYTQSAAIVGFTVPPSVERWLQRIREQPGYVAIKKDPLGKAP
jgi:glutathione S-transferase